MNDKSQYYIGIMSGTSMDGVDTVLVEFNNNKLICVKSHVFIEFTQSTKEELLELQNIGCNELHRSIRISQTLSKIFAQSVIELLNRENLKAADITAIGCHGQTIRHAPEYSYTVQIVDLPLLAELTKICTIGDFRSADIAAGGQGAPLVPAFHEYLFHVKDRSIVVLNIGGISNISILTPNKPTLGFDTGPGNMLMDALVKNHWNIPYDKDGCLAKQGNVINELLEQFLSHEYFVQKPPKSTGRDLFSLNWLNSYINKNNFDVHDILRTLLEFTAISIVNSIIQYADLAKEVYICGGGINNKTLKNRLTELLNQNNISLYNIDTLGIDPQCAEAAAFAWLALCWVNKTPLDLTKITGASHPCILGAGYYAFQPKN